MHIVAICLAHKVFGYVKIFRQLANFCIPVVQCVEKGAFGYKLPDGPFIGCIFLFSAYLERHIARIKGACHAMTNLVP